MSRAGFFELDRGKGIPHEGNYSTFLGVQEKRLKQEGSEPPRANANSPASANGFAIAQSASGKI